MTGRYEAEQPLYFGADADLFGLFHAPATPASKAVLLCPPLGQEQIRCHRLYRQLAHALVAEGMAVLRFDYYGCGDSAGSSVDVDWDRCLDDTVVAADELRERSGTDHVLAFGARLGGSIALTAGSAARFAGLTVWDPVLDGAAYAERLDAMQAALAVDTQRFIKPRLAAEAAAQWLGFAVGERLRRQLIELRLEPSGIPTLVLNSAVAVSTADGHGLSGERTTTVALPSSTPWDDLNRLELAILSHSLIQRVTDHWREVA